MAILLVTAGISFANIVGSKHDLSQTGPYGGAGTTALSACQFCHTPHLGTNAAVSGAPLWNRSLPASGSYTLYNSNGSLGTLADTKVNAPGPNSLTCLSCHDGTIALNSVLVGGTIGAITGSMITDNKLSDTTYSDLGTNLSNEHPIGVKYITGTAGLAAPVGNLVGATYKLYTASGEQRVECASCHDPHDTNGANAKQFIRGLQSTICTTCHSTK